MGRTTSWVLLGALACALPIKASDRDLIFALKGTVGLASGDLKDEVKANGFLGFSGEVAVKFGKGFGLFEAGYLSVNGDDQTVADSVINRKVEGFEGRVGYRYPVLTWGKHGLDFQGGVSFEGLKTTQEVRRYAGNYLYEDSKSGIGWWLGLHSHVHEHVSLEVNVASVGFYTRPVTSTTGVPTGEKEELHGLALEFSVGYVF